jgi:hypothetical protein
LGYHVALDGANDAYVTGVTASTDFPTKNPFQSVYAGNADAFVSKIDPSGSALLYSTYLGGSGIDNDNGGDIAVDSTGNAYVTGYTSSTDFPTKNPFQASNAGGSYGYDVFVTKINPTGSALIYSTYLGGSGDEAASSIAVDATGDAYVTGYTSSTNFPTRNALHGVNPNTYLTAFVSKFNPSGSALVYSTYLGGSVYDTGTGIAVDRAGDAYVTGFTYSTNFPLQGPFHRNYAGNGDAFVSKLNPAGTALFSSTYLGGNLYDAASGIAVDGAGNVYVTGRTNSPHFPTKNPLQSANAGGYDAFVTKLQMLVATTGRLSSSLNPSTYGESVTFTVTVTSSAGSPPNGETVTFMKGTTVLGTVSLSNGSASFTTSTLAVSRYAIKAVFGGDANLVGSTSNTITQVVNKATTTTSLTSSQNPSSVNQSVTFTATVTPQFSGTPTGSVTFKDGTITMGTVILSSGMAVFKTSKLTVGSHNITATYNGSAAFSTSSASVTQTVN